MPKEPAVAPTRIPVKIHKRVSLLQVADAVLAEELLARKGVARLIVGRLSPTALLVKQEEEETLLDELRRIGQTPRIVR